jgi:hypothetical protein
MREAKKAPTAQDSSPQVETRQVAIVMVAILVLLIAIAGGLTLFFGERIHRGLPQASAFPTPAVITDEDAQRRALEAAQRRLLAGGNGRLAIDEAMKRIVARGPQAYDPVGTSP